MRASEFDWEHCVGLISRGKVVPVVGPGLLGIETKTGRRLLYSEVGEELSKELAQEGKWTPGAEDTSLRAVAMGQDPRLKPEISRKIRMIWENLGCKPPQALLDLAAIRDFKLFLSTTFDPLLIDAVNEVRYGGEKRTLDLAYAPKRVEDLPAKWKKQDNAVVYRLLGRLSLVPDDYAISSEDVLEFLHSVPMKRKGAGGIKNLLKTLEGCHLLLLGCDFSKWQAGYFLRTLAGERLSTSGTLKVVADVSAPDEGKAVFLDPFGVTVYEGGDAQAFVAELAKRCAGSPAEAAPSVSDEPSVKNRVFISYKSEDLVHAKVLCDALKAGGFDPWMDTRDLKTKGGVDWNRKIKEEIRNAAVFIPCISRSTEEERQDSYVFREWLLAVEHARQWAPRSRYIWPVILDETRDPKNVPAELTKWQWSELSGGKPSAEFLHELSQELYSRNVGGFELTRRAV